MNKRNREKLEKFKTAQNSNKENQMSQDTQTVDAEFSKPKDQPNTGAQPGVEEKKETEKKGFFSVVIDKSRPQL
jgi:hypothetical protein